MSATGWFAESALNRIRPDTGNPGEDQMTKTAEPQFIESTAGEIAKGIDRRGIAPERHVAVAVEPDDWLAEVRWLTRPRVIAEGWSDSDIDRIIDEERDALRPRPE
jgi:hypothetical protein